jgi:hypothetical protein
MFLWNSLINYESQDEIYEPLCTRPPHVFKCYVKINKSEKNWSPLFIRDANSFLQNNQVRIFLTDLEFHGRTFLLKTRFPAGQVIFPLRQCSFPHTTFSETVSLVDKKYQLWSIHRVHLIHTCVTIILKQKISFKGRTSETPFKALW